MGKGQTPARVRAVLLPPRPAPRAEPAPDRTELRARAESSAVALEGVEHPLVAPAMSAAASVITAAPDGALPPVAPKPSAPVSLQPVSLQPVSLQPVLRHLLDCRVSVIPRLPVVNLEKPNSNWPDLTPSPVPRVSLVPPTGRLEPFQLRSAVEARSLPTVAPRTRALAPARTVPRLSKPAPRGWLSRRIARDLRSSKREIAFGLGIGIGLSFVLGKLGQGYLESRGATRAGVSDSWTASALPSPEPRAPLGNVALPVVAVPNPAVPSVAVPSADVRNAAVPSAVPALAQARAARLSATPLGAEPPSKARSTKAARRQVSTSRPSQIVPVSTDESTAEELEPPGKAPLSPSESAGLGRELPL